MEHPLHLILFIISLASGAIAIFFGFRLMQKYGLPFVGSYFYYLVFLYIFGVYSLAGSGLLEILLVRMGAVENTVHSARLFVIFMGIPLLVLSKYMWIRSVSEMLSRKLRSFFTLVYFLSSLGTFALYGTYVVRLTRFDTGDYSALVSVQRWVFTGILAASYTSTFLLALVRSGKLVHHERSFIRMHAFLYLLFMAVTCVSYIFSGKYEIIPYLFIVFFLSWHLVPILFMNVYLEKFHGQTASVQEDFDEHLSSFVVSFDISKRECEVIRLICKGLSNQEIGDALFISLQTVKDHIHRIFVKTGVRNRVQLANLIRSGRA